MSLKTRARVKTPVAVGAAVEEAETPRQRYNSAERQRLDRLYRELINPESRATRNVVPKNSQGVTGSPPEYAIDHPIEHSTYRESVIGLIRMVDNWAGLRIEQQRKMYLEYPVSLPFTLEQINEFCYLRNEGKPGMRSAYRNGASANWQPGEDDQAGGIVGAATYYLLLDRWIAKTQLEEWLEQAPSRIGVMRIREAREQCQQGKRGGSRLRRTTLLRSEGKFQDNIPQLNQILRCLEYLALQIEGKSAEYLKD